MKKEDAKKNIQSLLFGLNISMKASRFFTISRLLFEIIIAIVPLVAMYLSKQIINNLAYNATALLKNTFLLILFTAILTLTTSALGTLNNYIAQCHNDKIELIISQIKFKKSISIDLSYFDSSKYYNDYANASANAPAVPRTIWNLFHLIGISIKCISLFIVFARYSILLSLIMLVLSLPFALLENKFKKDLLIMQKKLMPSNRRMGYLGSIFTTRPYAMDMRLNQCDEFIYEKFYSDWNERYTQNKQITKKHSLVAFWVSNIPQILIVLITLALAAQVSKQTLLIGDYTYITGSAQQLLGGIIALIKASVTYRDSINRTNQFVDFLNIESKIANDGTHTISNDSPHKIEFVNVSFSYPDTTKKVLDNVNFVFYTNQKIALVGQNGSGKTTIVKLILRLYDVDSGAIYLDGINIKSYKASEVRNIFSVMHQNFNNYAFSLRETVALSSPNQRNETDNIYDALEKANAKPILEKIGSLETYLTRIYSEDGVELSGGEWQKIALARCFFKKSQAFIFDEPSSAMDARSEHELFELVHSELANRGMLLISHRLSNVKNSDQIFVLNNSTIIESGTHEELMDRNGLYADMYQLQLKKYI